MRRIAFGLVLLVVVGLFAGPAIAAPDIRVREVSCRGEWVDVRNVGNASKNLQGWRIRDFGNRHHFDFPSIVLPPGATVRVWGESKTGGPYQRWFTGWDAPVWNNDGDRAYVLTPGRQIKSQKELRRCGRAVILWVVAPPAARSTK